MASEWSISGVDLYLEPAAVGSGRRVWLETALRSAVRDGRLAPGVRLPPTRVLAAELGIARGTVTAAYNQLAAEGYLTPRRGAGTVVAELNKPGNDGRRSGPRPRESSLILSSVVPSTVLTSEPARPRHDLLPGRPDVAAFPVQQWLRAARRVLPRVEAEVFASGDPRGLPEFRRELAAYLGRVRGVRADPDAIVVVSGVMQGICLLAEVLYASGVRRIGMEEPSLPFHQEAVRRRGPQIVPLRVDEHGARCEFGTVPGDSAGEDPGRGDAGAAGPGRDRMATGATEPEALQPGAVLLTPAHQAGFGVVLAPERRRAFLDWARTSGGLIIEDDYDGEFRYDRQPVGAMQGMAPEHVAYLGTASKTLAPGLRIGWMVLPEALVPAVAEARFHTDVQHEVIGQLVLAELLGTLDYDRHVRAQRQRYRRRRDTLLRRLAGEVPEVRVRGAAAGVQLLLELPDPGPSEAAVLSQARRRGVRLATIGRVWQRPDRAPLRGAVVGYASPPEHAYPAAVDALIQTLRAAFDE